MVCADCQSLLSDHIDNDVTDRMRREIDAHLASCASCSVLREDLVRIIDVSGSLPLHTPSATVWNGIEKTIAGSGTVIAGPSSWWDRLGARRFDLSISGRQLAAAAALVVVAGGTLWTIKVASPGTLPNVDVNWNSFSTGDGVRPVTLSSSPANEELVRFRATVDAMQREVEARQQNASQELRSSFARTIADLDARIAERDKAFSADGTAQSRDSLHEALRDKLTFLDEFARTNPR